MKEISHNEIRNIAESIVNKANDTSNDYDAIDEVSEILKETLKKMDIAVEDVKNNPNCKCTNCGCNK
jgi:hypothetical protein